MTCVTFGAWKEKKEPVLDHLFGNVIQDQEVIMMF